MQRRAQRAQGEQHDERGGRVRLLRRALVCAAAVPAVLVAAGCSSGSGSDSASSSGDGAKPGSGASASASASASPTVQAARYAKLPESCDVLSKKTLSSLVPKAVNDGKEGTSEDTATRASCSWSSLDDNGVKGSQFRWLNVSLLRFESDTSRGSGEQRAQDYYTQQVKAAQTVEGAKNVKSQPVSGTGDTATAVRYDLKKKEGSFKQQTIVARVENVVVTVDYNGAGLSGDKTPSADGLTKNAEKATAEVVAGVARSNGDDSRSTGSGSGSDSGSGSASKSASPSASPSASKSSKSADKSAAKSSASPSSTASKAGS
ncbi:DUF3558 family protein [Streptomyces sp. NPDC008150]|uniref:DUF3558 family protein n=1 Tax=Streptomyces sp. NPDC008150 TaxID=3364816 RepID=UPI0036E2BDA6